MNNAVFVGRAGQEARLNSTGSGEKVANFSLAVDRFKKDAGPLWVSVSVWGKQGENLAQYITKGKQVAVAGEVDIRTYDYKGEQRTELTLRAASVRLLGGGERSDSQEAGGDEPSQDSEEINF